VREPKAIFYCENYTGDFGLADPQAQQGYLMRTEFWTASYRSNRTPGLP